MKAFVINLARAEARRAHMVEQLGLAGLDYEFVEAVDGASLDMSDRTLVAARWLGRSAFWPNVAGCALSHLEVYRRILAQDLPSAVVLEDDVLLDAGVGEVAETTGALLRDAEVALLNFHSEKALQLSGPAARSVANGFKIAPPLEVDKVGSGGAYVITKAACRRLSDAVIPVRVPSDDWAYFCRVGVLDRVWCSYPIAVKKSPRFRSTIGYYRPGGLRERVSIWSHGLPVAHNLLELRRDWMARRWIAAELAPAYPSAEAYGGQDGRLR